MGGAKGPIAADASPGVKKAFKHLVALAKRAKTHLADRNRVLGVYSEEDSRDLDNEADRAWGGLRVRLTGFAGAAAVVDRLAGAGGGRVGGW